MELEGGGWSIQKCPEMIEEMGFCPAQLRKLRKATLPGVGVWLGVVLG